MNKQQYLSRLEKALSGLPADDLRERLAFYGESIAKSTTGWKKA